METVVFILVYFLSFIVSYFLVENNEEHLWIVVPVFNTLALSILLLTIVLDKTIQFFVKE